MSKKPKTQTTPEGEEIPVPKRKDVMRDLRTVAKPEKESPSRSRPKKK